MTESLYLLLSWVMRKLVLASGLLLILFTLSLGSIYAAVEKLAPCSSGSLKTSVYKDYQMLYKDEDFLRLNHARDLLKDVAQLKELTCLQYVDTTGQGVKGDIVNLKKLVNLEVFGLSANPQVSGDICSLAEATKLRSLKLAFSPKVYGDIACLKKLKNLETFAMIHTQISGDLADLSHMTKLKALYINGTNITGDISALSMLTDLEELGISDESENSSIGGDLASLDKLTRLRKVSLYNTKAINCEQFTKSHPNIEEGGCFRESSSTLEDDNKSSERKIGKEVRDGEPDKFKKYFFSKFSNLNFLEWLKGLFKR